MTNEQIIRKMTEDMEMRGFSKWTKESYLSKTKDVMKYGIDTKKEHQVKIKIFLFIAIFYFL